MYFFLCMTFSNALEDLANAEFPQQNLYATYHFDCSQDTKTAGQPFSVYIKVLVFNETVVKTFGQQKSSYCLHPNVIHVFLFLCTNNYICKIFM